MNTEDITKIKYFHSKIPLDVFYYKKDFVYPFPVILGKWFQPAKRYQNISLQDGPAETPGLSTISC